jgi:hypothetical protein
MSHQFREFAESMKIKLLNFSPYYAQANGQAEASNKVLIIITILRNLLIHIGAASIQVVVQIIKVILQPEQVLLIVPHKCMIEMELRYL